MDILTHKIVTRSEAIALGSKTYFILQPCSQGHISYRYVSNGNCKICLRESARKWYKENPVQVKAGERRWRTANKTKHLATRHKRIYGVTIQDQLKIQNGCCSICLKPLNENGQGSHQDHDKVSGKNRAVLCQNCNPGLGQFKHSPELLRRAALYIEYWQTKI